MQSAYGNVKMILAFKRYFLDLKKAQWWNRKTIETYKWKKFKETLDYAYNNVDFYKSYFKKAGIEPKDIKSRTDIYKLPLTTKQDILLSNLNYVSDEYMDEKIYTSRTSGSTGEPFVSYFDKRAWEILKFASKLRGRVACGFNLREKFVIVEAMGVDEANKYNNSFGFGKYVLRKRVLSVYDSFENHVKFFRRFKSDSIYGFPSYFVNLVSYLEKNKVSIPNVKRIFTSSEVLDERSRNIIESYFGCRVCDVYGSTETKEVCWECDKHEGYHINEDLVYVEIVDRNGKEVKKGEQGRIVVTSLQNMAMPLIRYCIGDTGVMLKKKCSCGRSFALMRPVYGREIDYFILKDGRELSPYELTMSVEGIEGIIQYKIVQKSKSLVEMSLRVNEKFRMASKKVIVSNLKNILGSGVNINLKFVDYFENGNRSRKFRVVSSEVKR